jgi:hypothetical protein
MVSVEYLLNRREQSPLRLQRHGQPHAILVTWIGTYRGFAPGVLTIALVSVLLTIVNGVSQDSAAEGVRVKILNAWKARRDAIRTARLDWESNGFRTKGSLMSLDEAQENTVNGKPIPTEIPDRDVSVSGSNVLIVDLDKLSHRGVEASWSHDQRQFVPCQFHCATNGRLDARWTGPGALAYSSGHVNSGNKSSAVDLTALEPLLLAVRVNHPDFIQEKLTGFAPKTEPELWNGQKCLILESAAIEKKRGWQYWIDPAKGYSIVRKLYILDGGNIRRQLEIEYKQHEKSVWLPERWTNTGFDANGKIAISDSVQVTRSEINSPIDKAEFEVVFPIGSFVHDVSGKSYIVRKDGSKRWIDESEYGPGASYEVFLATDPDRPRESRPAHWFAMAALAFGAVGLILAGYWSFKHRRA